MGRVRAANPAAWGDALRETDLLVRIGGDEVAAWMRWVPAVLVSLVDESGTPHP